MNIPQIMIKNLTKEYRSQVVFADLNFNLDSSKIYFLTKENGGGKTTFFNCLLRECGFSGEIIDDGLSYCYLPEKPLLPDFISVKTFISMFVDNVSDLLINQYLILFKISKYQNQLIYKLSKGTKQKVVIIKTLLSNADVFLFDEPLSGLDQESRNTFFKLIAEMNNKIIIIATHYLYEYPLKQMQVILS